LVGIEPLTYIYKRKRPCSRQGLGGKACQRQMLQVMPCRPGYVGVQYILYILAGCLWWVAVATAGRERHQYGLWVGGSLIQLYPCCSCGCRQEGRGGRGGGGGEGVLTQEEDRAPQAQVMQDCTPFTTWLSYTPPPPPLPHTRTHSCTFLPYYCYCYCYMVQDLA